MDEVGRVRRLAEDIASQLRDPASGFGSFTQEREERHNRPELRLRQIAK
jgi:hypothetical protein